MERRIKEINRFTVGWTAYFCFADTFLPFDKLDKWLRRRLRQVRWKEWKRSPTRYRNLRALGIRDRDARSWAASQKGYWRVAGILAAPTSPAKRLLARVTRPERIPRPLPRFPGMLSEPPGADPHAGWCGRGQGKPGLYPILREPGGAMPPGDPTPSLTEAALRLPTAGERCAELAPPVGDGRLPLRLSNEQRRGHDPGSLFEILPTESRISSPGLVQRFGAPADADAPGHPPGRDGCAGRAKARGST